MRAFDLFVFCICLNLGVGLVHTVFTNENEKSYYQEQKGEGWTHNVSDASALSATNTTPISGALEMTKWMIGAMMFFVSMISSIIWIYPALCTTFMIPPAISAILQTLIYIIYASAIIQWYSNRPFKSFD